MVVKKIRTRKNKEPERAKDVHFCKSLADSLVYVYYPKVLQVLGVFQTAIYCLLASSSKTRGRTMLFSRRVLAGTGR